MSLINIYEPTTLQAITKVVPAKGGFFTNRIFSKPMFSPTTKVKIDFAKGVRRLATFVADGAGATKQRKTGYKTVEFDIPLIKEHMSLTEKDLQSRAYGESPYSGQTEADRAYAIQAEQLQELSDSIDRRVEWMAAQALVTGRIPIIGEGIKDIIDLEFSNRGVSDWADPTMNPIDDMRNWIEQCQKSGYRRPNIVVMDTVAFKKFCDNPNTKDVYNKMSINSSPKAIEVLDENVTYGGTIVPLALEIYVYTEWYIDDWTDESNPKELPLLPEGTVLLIPTTMQATSFFGAVTLANEATGQFETFVQKKVVDTYMEKNPDVRYLLLNSRPLTMPHEIDAWFSANV